MIGKIPPTSGLVDQFFNTSTGHGEDGELDPAVRGIGARSFSWLRRQPSKPSQPHGNWLPARLAWMTARPAAQVTRKWLNNRWSSSCAIYSMPEGHSSRRCRRWLKPQRRSLTPDSTWVSACSMLKRWWQWCGHDVTYGLSDTTQLGVAQGQAAGWC